MRKAKRARRTIVIKDDNGQVVLFNLPGRRERTQADNHPLVVRTLQLIDLSGRTRSDVGLHAGYPRETFSRWDKGTRPLLAAVDDVLHALGYRLTIIPLNQKDKKP